MLNLFLFLMQMPDLTHIERGVLCGWVSGSVGMEFVILVLVVNIATNVLIVIVVFRFFYLNVGTMIIYLALFSCLCLFSVSIFVTCGRLACVGPPGGGKTLLC